MKKLLLTLCFILAIPILVSWSQTFYGSDPCRVYACENQMPGNTCGNGANYKRHNPSKSDGKGNGSPETGFPIQEIGSGLAVLAPVFMIWLGLRR